MSRLRNLLLIITLATLALLAAALWFYPLNDDFNPANPFWNGLSQTGEDLRLTSLNTLAVLPDLPPDARLLLIPYTPFDAAELEALKAFTERGGTLVLADDFGHGNAVLQGMGLDARFASSPLLDPIASYRYKRLPRVDNLRDGPLTRGVTSLGLNHATGLINVPAGDVIAWSSSFGFLDVDNSGEHDPDEPVGPIAVASTTRFGRGTIVLISDPSVFINAMAGRECNREFIRNLAHPERREMYLDRSHLPVSALQEAKSVLAGLREGLLTPPGTLALLTLLLLALLSPVWRVKKIRSLSGEG
ncbi:MAG: hypothetical protein HYX96_00845 [Chloroflexi bacterium]|nr:hypothetical protein [Chloroflexota bacterium]